MKIETLRLKNWKSHEDTSLQFGAVNLIRGPNNAGKSSVGEAIEFLLTGRCALTGEAGQGGDVVVRVGAKEATIQAQIAGNPALTIMRTRNHAGGQVTLTHSGRSYAGRQVEDMLARRGWSKDILSAALRVNRFAWLDSNEQKELLADLLKPDSEAIPKEIADIMRALASEILPVWSGYIGTGTIDLQGARLVEKDAISARASCTGALKQLGDPEAPPEKLANAPSADHVIGKLNKLRSEQSKLLAEKARLEESWANASRRWRELPELIAKVKAQILDSKSEADHMKVVENEPQARKAEEELAGIHAVLAEYQRQLAEVPEGSNKCPTCGAEADTDALRKRIGESAKSAKSRIPGLQLVASTGTSARESERILRAHREATVSLGKLEAEQKAAAPADPTQIKPLEKQIAELEERIIKGQQILNQASAYEQKANAYQEAVVRRKRLEDGRAAADTLAKWMGPSGVQAKMSAGKLGPFLEAINGTLEKFGYHCKLEMEPFDIRVSRLATEQSLELGSLSESEKWRFSLAFQAAIAKVTGLNLIVCDGADILVGPNRGALLKAVVGAGIEQVFILASVDRQAQLPPEITVFDLALEAGRTIAKKGG